MFENQHNKAPSQTPPTFFTGAALQSFPLNFQRYKTNSRLKLAGCLNNIKNEITYS